MGHELVGRVVEAGPAVMDLVPGDRVTLRRYLPCCSIKESKPVCVRCRDENHTLCENFSEGAARRAASIWQSRTDGGRVIKVVLEINGSV
mgnify:CR=1 FL=1